MRFFIIWGFFLLYDTNLYTLKIDIIYYFLLYRKSTTLLKKKPIFYSKLFALGIVNITILNINKKFIGLGFVFLAILYPLNITQLI